MTDDNANETAAVDEGKDNTPADGREDAAEAEAGEAPFYNPDPPAFADEPTYSPVVRFCLGVLFAAVTLAMLVTALHCLECLKEMALGTRSQTYGW